MSTLWNLKSVISILLLSSGAHENIFTSFDTKTLTQNVKSLPWGTIHQLTKKSRINLWSALSWAKDDPKKGRRLSLQANGQLLPSNRLRLCGAQNKKAGKNVQDLP